MAVLSSKASYIRYLIGWVAVKAEEAAVAKPSPHSTLRAAAIWGLARYIRVLDVSGLVLSDTEVDAAYDAARLFLKGSQELRFTRPDVYRTRPKWHFFDHSVDYMKLSKENPRHPMGNLRSTSGLRLVPLGRLRPLSSEIRETKF